MTVPQHYFLSLDAFNNRENNLETYGGYKKTEIISLFLKEIKKNNFEKACALGVELDISDFTHLLLKKLLYFSVKEINITNPQLPLYLWKRFSYIYRFEKNSKYRKYKN